MPIDKTKFKELFMEKEIVYIAGYINGYKRNSKALYALFCSIDLNKKMEAQVARCIFMNVG